MEQVRVWEEQVIIPTYDVGEPEKHPVFSDRRVYQGSSGRVYPYPVIEKIQDEKKDKAWKAVWLENQYLKVMVLPELGGRIQRAYDKTNDYDFVYYNHVIKPALVGLTGPWISGGIEFNWPQHHRPTTYRPVDYTVSTHEDGSCSVLVHDVDQMYGTKGLTSFTLYPDKAYIEIRGQLYNRTPMAQTFLWWANPAVAVNENTQSVFPPDVHAVMDHGKRDVSKFPIATGVYYKHDYSAGVDISRYKNIPVPTSYMAEKSDYDFVGGYDYGVDAGILHVADHHISPGKKQWTWGSGDFGQAWDRNLTDEDGPYIELMTGVYTDNQPDFTWLKPFEEKTFKQYFMPYKQVGYVKNATTDAIIGMETEQGAEGSGLTAKLKVYTTGVEKDVKVQLLAGGQVIFEETAEISPVQVFSAEVQTECSRKQDLTIRVLRPDGREMVSFTPPEETIPEIPSPAEAAKAPKEIQTCEELYLTGLHLEQYRHATYAPDDYYLEGLRRDDGDIRLNTAYGMLLLRRGLFTESEKYFRKALKRMTWKNPNPYSSEALYDLGLCLFYQERMAEAFDAFYKATWTNEQQEMSFYFLACIAARRGEYKEALEFIEKALVKNAHNIKARGLKALLLKKLGRSEQADRWLADNLELDPFDFVSGYIKACGAEDQEAEKQALCGRMRQFPQNFIQTAIDLRESGFYAEAAEVLELCTTEWPMIDAYRADCLCRLSQAAEGEEAAALLAQAKAAACKADQDDSYTCFVNRLEDISVLNTVQELYPEGAKASYYLGNLWYDKRQYDKALACWEKSAALDAAFSTVQRNLSLIYYNQEHDKDKALERMEAAFALDTTDSRIFLELDQLYKKLNRSIEERLAFYDRYPETFKQRDDLYIEYVTLLNTKGEYQKAYELVTSRNFHPWEGGEGKATTQYETALSELAKIELKAGNAAKAKQLLEEALVYPVSLGEGRLEGTKDNHIFYLKALAEEMLGEADAAAADLAAASVGSDEVAGMMFYNDQPADMILFQGQALEKLGRPIEANSRFYKLTGFGEAHIYDEVKMDYFAVSYPDLLIFEDDFTARNQAHCNYVMGLGNLGLGDYAKAELYLRRTLELDPAHQKAALYLRQITG